MPGLKRYGEAYLLYQRRLKEADAMDFDDLIVQTVRLLEEQEDVLEYYQNKYPIHHGGRVSGHQPRPVCT